MMMKDQRWLVHLCGIVGAGGLCALMYLTLILPLDTRRMQVRDDRTAYERAKVELSTTQRAMTDDQAAILRLEEKLRDAVQLQPFTRLNARLSELSALAEANGVVISALRPDPPARTAHYTATSIAVQAEGGTSQYLALLDALHAQARDVEVRSFELRSSGDPRSPRLDIRMVLTWYALPDGGTPTRTAATPSDAS
jgi:Tfp pilus assembly protein PilO